MADARKSAALADLDSLLGEMASRPSSQAVAVDHAELDALLSDLAFTSPSAHAMTVAGPAGAPAPDDFSLVAAARVPHGRNKARLKATAEELSEGLAAMKDALRYPGDKLTRAGGGVEQSLTSSAAPSAQQAASLAGGEPVGQGFDRSAGQAPQQVMYGGGPSQASAYEGLPVCHRCKGAIPGECVLAMDKHYHPAHFLCTNCHQLLDIANFFSIADEPHCGPCYAKLSSSCCQRCKQMVRPGEALYALNTYWHPEHFTCTQCNVRLSSRFYNKGGHPFCETCTNYSTDACALCGQVIGTAQSVTALGRKWHLEHLVCSVCRIPAATTGQVWERGGVVYCQTHYAASAGGVKCDSCAGVIEGEKITVGVKSWHPAHFKCKFCWCNLTQEAAQASPAGDCYCAACFEKLF